MKVKFTGLDGGDAQLRSTTLAAGLMESTADGAGDTSGCRDFRRRLINK